MADSVTKPPNVFTMEAIEAMNRAYEEALDVLRAQHAGYSARVKAGETIMRLAKDGETDERQLCDQALGAVGYAVTDRRKH